MGHLLSRRIKCAVADCAEGATYTWNDVAYRHSEVMRKVYTCTTHAITEGRCPICGEAISLRDSITVEGRLIGSCGDAFWLNQWLSDG